MKNSESLKKTYEFQNVYRNGKSYANKYLVMYVLENNLEKNNGCAIFNALPFKLFHKRKG